MHLVSVIPITNAPLPETLTYYTRSNFSVGDEVLIPVGNRTLLGYVHSYTPLSKNKAAIRQFKFEIKPLDESAKTGQNYALWVSALQQLNQEFEVPLHHTAHSMLPKIFVPDDHSSPKIPEQINHIIIAPTWRQALFLQRHQPDALILHSSLTAKQQAKVLAHDTIDTLITTPSYAGQLIARTNRISIFSPEHQHYYRYRAPFFDTAYWLELLASLYKIPIARYVLWSDEAENLAQYHALGETKHITYTLVIHPEILIHIKKLLDAKEKVLVITPRRGFAAGVRCKDCGQIATDPDTEERYKVVETPDGFVYESNRHHVAARHTCQFCNGTRIEMYGFGSRALAKVLQRNFSTVPFYCIEQETGKRALASADAEEHGLVLGTHVARHHLTPKTYHTVLLGIDFLLGIGHYDQTRHLTDLIQSLEQHSKSVFIPAQHAHGEEWEALSRHDYQKLLELDTSLRQRFHYPPYGHLVTAEAYIAPAAEDHLTRNLRAIIGEYGHLHTLPSSTGRKRLTLEFACNDRDTVTTVVAKVRTLLPNATIRHNPK